VTTNYIATRQPVTASSVVAATAIYGWRHWRMPRSVERIDGRAHIANVNRPMVVDFYADY
jgi:hypothetical protein